jgi:hypothetical protein
MSRTLLSLAGFHGRFWVIAEGSSRNSKLQSQKRLAWSLKLAIGTLETNIRKLKRTEASPLLIATRKKPLARMKEELTQLAH